jgi:nitrile hydratase beta subunit
VNGVHDIGGMHGLGPIPIESNEPVFHADWERRMYAMARQAMTSRLIGLDEFRHAIERIPPARYLSASYYEKWLMGFVGLLLEKGIIKRSELKGGPPVELVPAVRMEPDAQAHRARVRARFKRGDRVFTRNFTPRHHTRIPRYARGRHGVIDRDEGVFALPDTYAHGGGPNAQHVYSVRFAARELWGENAPAREYIYIDLWEGYLEPDPQFPRSRSRR